MVIRWHSSLERPARSGDYLVCTSSYYITICPYSKNKDLFNWHDSFDKEPNNSDFEFNSSVIGWAECEKDKAVAAIKRAERKYRQIGELNNGTQQ